ncbi:TRAP transporter small permease subunit [Azospirillum sp. sgz301742]
MAAARHIRITFPVDRLPPGLRRLTETIAWGAALVMFSVLIWRCWTWCRSS